MGYFFIEDGIIIQFLNGWYYLYTHRKPGKYHVEQMKALAVKGKGLKTYINQYVRNNYEDKFNNLPPSLAA